MQHGVISRTSFQLGNIDFYIDYQDNRYYGESAHKYYVPSASNDDSWGFDCYKQFRTELKCEMYMKNALAKLVKPYSNH